MNGEATKLLSQRSSSDLLDEAMSSAGPALTLAEVQLRPAG